MLLTCFLSVRLWGAYLILGQLTMLLKQLQRPVRRRYFAYPVGDFHLIVVKLEGRIISIFCSTVN